MALSNLSALASGLLNSDSGIGVEDLVYGGPLRAPC